MRRLRVKDMTWPDPADTADLEWALRYGTADEVAAVRYEAAAVVASYRQLATRTGRYAGWLVARLSGRRLIEPTQPEGE